MVLRRPNWKPIRDKLKKRFRQVVSKEEETASDVEFEEECKYYAPPNSRMMLATSRYTVYMPIKIRFAPSIRWSYRGDTWSLWVSLTAHMLDPAVNALVHVKRMHVTLGWLYGDVSMLAHALSVGLGISSSLKTVLAFCGMENTVVWTTARISVGWKNTVVLIPKDGLRSSLESVRDHVPMTADARIGSGSALDFEKRDIHMQMHPSAQFLALDDEAKAAALQAFRRYAAWRGILI